MSSDLRVGGHYRTPDGLEFVVLEIHDDGSVYVESGPSADHVNAGWYRPTGEETSITHQTREILVHLNVTMPGTDQRTADEVAAAILGALEVGSDDDSVRDLTIVAPLAEEI